MMIEARFTFFAIWIATIGLGHSPMAIASEHTNLRQMQIQMEATLSNENRGENSDADSNSGGCEGVDGYIPWQGKDSEGFDILPQVTTASLQDIASACNNDVRCQGFNTRGWLKEFIQPADQWVQLPPGSSECAGLYQKESDQSAKVFGEKIMDIARTELQKDVRENGGIDYSDEVDDEQNTKKEWPANKNVDDKGEIRKYIATVTWGDMRPNRPPESWCADFVSWVYEKAGMPLNDPRSVGKGIPNTDTMIRVAKTRNQWHPFQTGYIPLPGDLIILSWQGRGTGATDHVGLIEKIVDKKTFITIEGNTRDPAGIDYEGIYRKTRVDWSDRYKTNIIEGFIGLLGDVGARSAEIPVNEGEENNEDEGFPT